MATTSIISRKANKKSNAAGTMKRLIAYDRNADKTGNGQFVSAYQCAPDTAEKEFMISKQLYEVITERHKDAKDDVLMYRVLQSFKPGEISPEEANEIGYKLAMELTGGNHQFVVSTHTNKAHIHNHIDFNSTTLDCSHKYREPHKSALLIRNISDRLCREHGKSVVENPGNRSMSHSEWSANRKGTSWKALLQKTIDEALSNCATFDDFLMTMESRGYEIKQGKYLAFRAPGQSKFTRARAKTLGEDYSEEAMRARVGKAQRLPSSQCESSSNAKKRFNLLVDIQAKLQAGKGPGYERWATIHNLKEKARTLNFLTENGITDYAVLEERAAQASANLNALSSDIRQIEGRMAEIAALKTHIFNYSKTREIYKQYQKSRFKTEFCAEHETEILLHEAAKRAFDALHVKKLPTVAALSAEYAGLLAEKKTRYAGYADLKKEAREWSAAKANVDRILNIPMRQPDKKERDGPTKN